ncbi:TIGR03564 family F420-dependent LLM class oxidoreductase [Rhabdothermincola salaria]|uniref:TIGR03564 family F420-dependent LLM class oxidoreductase n=1 Tax=Rhabdothermincola salaria TaxID=2903142 RepID=UPI001E40D17A|nr:TIGR03564 family F420-dependent LLM class oxidoreductase [Rhabdothermincola salaria]MCD9623709.1 TIGR03564 family F420-dependent LLM class oxidoreductase [Rhabdothermincola salaria]
MTPAISLWAGHDTVTVDALTERVQAAADLGIPGVWVPQTAALDTLTALAVVADRVPDIAVGSAVVPIQGRHPIALALQALTLADVAGADRVTLGIGVTHKPVSEGWFGIPYADVVGLAAETLEVLEALLAPERTAAVEGEHLTARITLGMPVAPPGMVVAALGPKMLDLAGRHSDGTVTWMTGPVALERDVVPRLASAAETAGRRAPRVIVGLPVCVTDDVAGARERLAPMMAGPVHMDSYRRMVEAEGIADPVDLVVLGDEDTVAARIEGLADAGATELLANVVGEPGERLRTLDLLARLTRSS